MKLPENEGFNLPTLLFATISGLFGVIASLPREEYELLDKVQQNMAKVVHGVGGFQHDE